MDMVGLGRPALRKLLAAGFFLCAAMSASAQPKADQQLRLADAQVAAGKVIELAKAKGISVAVVVVNREGRVILAQRMDDTSFVNLKVAESKAVTAAAISVPTQLLDQMPEKEKLSLLAIPDVMTIAGGVPVVMAGKTIAGIGVSGSAPDDDHAMADAGLKAAFPGHDRPPQ